MNNSLSNAFDRGFTFYNGTTIDTNDYGGVHLEGEMREFPDMDPSNRMVRRSGDTVVARIVRNTSGTTLKAGQVATYASGQFGKRVDGLVRTTAAKGHGVVDEFLGSNGVPNGDLFWLVVQGPTRILSSLAGNAEDVIAEGGVLVALTAATSQATTAGRVIAQDSTGATTPLADQIQNAVGRAISANTTAQTNRLFLAYVDFLK